MSNIGNICGIGNDFVWSIYCIRDLKMGYNFLYYIFVSANIRTLAKVKALMLPRLHHLSLLLKDHLSLKKRKENNKNQRGIGCALRGFNLL